MSITMMCWNRLKTIRRWRMSGHTIPREARGIFCACSRTPTWSIMSDNKTMRKARRQAARAPLSWARQRWPHQDAQRSAVAEGRQRQG